MSLSAAAIAALANATSEPVDAASPAASSVASQPAEVSIPNTRRMDFVSKINGHRYSVSVALPFQPVPAKGYGVLYVLDGDMFFASATEIVRGHANAPEGVVVVGMGYPQDKAWVRNVLAIRGQYSVQFNAEPPARGAEDLERTYDLTLPAGAKDLNSQTWPGSDKPRSVDVGGADDFLRIIETEVKPRIAALTRIDPTNQVLFGDSYAGLTALHALFVEPRAFRTFIIGSPTIYWNNRSVLADKAKFAAAVQSRAVSPHVIVTMGGLEDSPFRVPASWGWGPAENVADVRASRMIENGRDLVSWLKSLHGGPDYVVSDYVVFDNLTHAISPWPALSWGISFAFPMPADEPVRSKTASARQ